MLKTIIVSLSLIFGKALLSSYQSSRFDFDSQRIHDQRIYDQRIYESVINMNERLGHSFENEDNDRHVILVRSTGKPNPVTLPTNRGPSSFPTPQPRSGNRSSGSTTYVPKYRTVPKVVNKGLGAGGNPAGQGGGDDNGAAEVDDQCFGLENQRSEELTTSSYDYHSNEKKKKRNKRRKAHLDLKVKVNGKTFFIERTQVEKKAVRHGIDLGLDPHIGIDGKPMINKKTKKPLAKANKKNFELFTDKLEKFIKNSEMREGTFRKGRAGEQETYNFYNADTDRVAIFSKDTRKFISFWKMGLEGQLDEFIDNNNVN